MAWSLPPPRITIDHPRAVSTIVVTGDDGDSIELTIVLGIEDLHPEDPRKSGDVVFTVTGLPEGIRPRDQLADMLEQVAALLRDPI